MIYRLDPRTMSAFRVIDYFHQFNNPDAQEFPLTQAMADNAINLAGSAPALKGDPSHPDSVTQRQNTELAQLRKKCSHLGERLSD